MTKKDCELIASVIKATLVETTPGGSARFAIEVVARTMGERLRSTNPHFNRERFVKACGVEE